MQFELGELKYYTQRGWHIASTCCIKFHLMVLCISSPVNYFRSMCKSNSLCIVIDILYVIVLAFDRVDRFLFSQPGCLTIQRWKTLWKPPHSSVDLFPYVKFISGLYWKVKRCSPKVRLNCSMIPWSLWMFTFPLLILTPCFAVSLMTSPMNSCPGSTWRTLGHLSNRHS